MAPGSGVEPGPGVGSPDGAEPVEHLPPPGPGRGALVLGLVAATVGVDRVTKLAAEAWLAGRGRLSWLGDTVRLELTHNSGAFLGLGARLPPAARSALFVAGVGLVVVGALWVALRSRRLATGQAAALALLGGGGLGNLWDRIAAGAVTDFANLGVGWLRTGIFNVADVAIMAGVAWLVWPRRVAGAPPAR